LIVESIVRIADVACASKVSPSMLKLTFLPVTIVVGMVSP